MSADSKHFQTQSVTLLAIATAAVGFGLFGAEFRVSMEFLPTAKFMAAGSVLVVYVALVRSVRGILESDDVTGKDVVRGPLFYLLLLVFYVVSIFVIDIFENPAGHPLPKATAYKSAMSSIS